MKKELIICVIIIFTIIVGNIFTESYTSDAVTLISDNLHELRNDVISDIENVDAGKVMEKTRLIEDKWHEVYYIMADFIEREELEKVETSLIAIESYIEAGEYGESVSKIDESVFILEHIKKKYEVTLQNIF